MGLKKNKLTRFGIGAEYHRILSVTVNNEIKFAVIDVGSYVSKDIRDGGAKPLERFTVNLPESDFDFDLEGNIFSQAYGIIKNLETFKGALDL